LGTTISCANDRELLNTMEERIISGSRLEDEQTFELSLRPKFLKEYIGQQQVKDNLAIPSPPHDLVRNHGLSSPRGWEGDAGYVIANELGVGLKLTSGPDSDQGDLTTLTNLQEHDVLSSTRLSLAASD
jgi:Holliday junction DNA helicase RuvB